MSIIIVSKTFDGLIIENHDSYKNLSFPNITSLHYFEKMRSICYIFENNWKEINNMSLDDWKIIENHYDNYHIGKITLELMKNDPISSLDELEERAKQFYFKQKNK